MRSDNTTKIKTLIGVVPSGRELTDLARPEPVLPRGSMIAGSYRVEQLIARGRTASIYLATQRTSAEKVAVRFLAPALFQVASAREQFMNSAALSAQIRHPNLLENRLFGGEHGSLYTLSECLQGETLADRNARQRLSPHEAVALLLPILRAVATTHAGGLIHGEIKPNHIFLSRAQAGGAVTPKLLGFGTSLSAVAVNALRSSSSSAGTLTEEEHPAPLYPPHYLAPEQLRNSRNVDARTDVYALGVCLFEAISGRKPFAGGSHSELVRKILTAATPPLTRDDPRIDPRLAQVIACAMSRDPNARFPSVEAFALALEPFGAKLGFRDGASAAKQPRAMRSPRKGPKQQHAHVSVAVALLMCTVVALYVLRSPHRRALASNRPARAQLVKRIAEPRPPTVLKPESAMTQETEPPQPAKVETLQHTRVLAAPHPKADVRNSAADAPRVAASQAQTSDLKPALPLLTPPAGLTTQQVEPPTTRDPYHAGHLGLHDF